MFKYTVVFFNFSKIYVIVNYCTVYEFLESTFMKQVGRYIGLWVKGIINGLSYYYQSIIFTNVHVKTFDFVNFQ